jgi:hypothetical protein
MGCAVFNVCPQCGQYRADKIIDQSGPFAICPECGYRVAFRQMPLLLIGGASGTGKSAVVLALAGRLDGVVLLESDILWGPHFDQPGSGYRPFFEQWLRVAKNIGQSGRPVALFGAGLAVPDNIEPCVERRYFTAVHYLALVCREDVLAARLRARPGWRRSGEESFVAGQLQFNAWFMGQGQRATPPIALLDTTDRPLADSAQQVAVWIAEHAALQTKPVN